MTTQKLIEILRQSPADAWEITDTVTEGWDFYFIRHRLDQNRVRNVRHIEVRVYRRHDDGASLGSAATEIPPTASEEEARSVIDGLYEDAAYVKNPVFRLNAPVPLPEAEETPADPADIAKAYLTTMAEIPESASGDLNSYEIFADRCVSRFVNSEGIDVTQTYPVSMLEVVVNARDADREIELYRLYDAGTCDRELLSRNIAELMKFGRDRLAAKPTPPLGTAAVVFSTQDAVEIYRWFANRMRADNKYMKLSDWETGKPCFGHPAGDSVTLHARAFLPGSSRNRRVDREGAPIRDLTIIEEGVPVHYWGSRQFCSYLGVEDGFFAENFEIRGGTGAEEDLRRGSYLEIVEFSDFSVDGVTGDIAGEIRLGYWHHEDEVTPVTGGSISGSLRLLAPEMRFSTEQRQYDCWLIPRLTRLEGVNVTGIEN